MMKHALRSTLLAAVVVFLAAGPAIAAPVGVADVLLGTNQIEWVPNQEFAGLKLTVSGPDGVTEMSFEPGVNPRFELAALVGDVDGIYTWELTASPVLDANVRSVMAESRVDGAGDGARSRPAGLPPRDSLIQSGSFRVVDGAIVQPADEGTDTRTTATGDPNVRRATAAQVISGDLTVYNALCVGFDCATAESYGADSIRLKENNLRIHFDDTSSSGSFPNRDWRLVANDSNNGGRNVFYLEDSTAGREVFSVEAGAPTNALWVDSTGNIGAGTSSPVLQLHIKDGNTPGMRLEQDNSSGFTAQTWDVAGNEANFFVRDVTGGSLLSFRIRPGAPSSSIDIAADGDVGIGTASPDADLHVGGSDGGTSMLISETNGTATERDLVEISNNGNAIMRITNTASSSEWRFGSLAGDFQMTKDGSGVIEFRIFGGGDATFAGDVTATSFIPSSSRTLKENFVPVDKLAVLERVNSLPLMEWEFIRDQEDARHLGPFSEDFQAAFGLNGEDDEHINLTDLGGVALAAIQGLSQVLDEKEREIAELRTQNQELAERLGALEAAVQP